MPIEPQTSISNEALLDALAQDLIDLRGLIQQTNSDLAALRVEHEHLSDAVGQLQQTAWKRWRRG